MKTPLKSEPSRVGLNGVVYKTQYWCDFSRPHVCNARVWGVTFKMPDNPVATLIFDNVEGQFTYNDGTVKKLTRDRRTMSVRQWHQYPNMLPRELYCDDELTGEKFETL